MDVRLEVARETARRMREEGTYERRDPLEKVQANPASLRLAINAKCFDCVGGASADNGYHRAVRECPATRCPLHAVRPWK